MNSENFKEHLVLIFLNKFIENEGICSSDTDEEDTLENANQMASSIYLYVNAVLAAHEDNHLEIRTQATAVPKNPVPGLLGLK